MSIENRPSIKPKDKNILLAQLDSANQFSNKHFGSNLIPPNLDNNEGRDYLIGLDQNSLNTQFPRRMVIYQNILHAQRNQADIVEETNRNNTLWLKVLNNLDQYIESHRGSSDEDRTLYEQQFTVFEGLRDFLEQGGTEGYIKLPTGSGKTVLFTEFVEATGLKTLVVAPTRILVDQTVDKFKLFAPQLQTGKVYTEEKDYSKQVTVTTYDSLIKGIANGSINPQDYELLILDEVHKSLTQRRFEAVNQFTNAIKLGFTATPKYSPDKHVGNLLNTEIHNLSIREGVETGMLSSLSVFLALTDVDLSNVKIIKSGEYLDRDLDRAVNIESRNRSAVELYHQMFKGQKAVAYCVSIQHAKDLAEMFRKQDISAEVVFGNQYRVEQKDILGKYTRGEIQVICNADILIEGFDDPSTAVCLNLRPTLSPVVSEQRAGRVLRFDPNNPFKHAYIVDFLDKHADPNNFPVSFAQIVQGAHVYKKGAEDKGGEGTGGGTPQYPNIEITGLQVITEAEEVIRIIKPMVDQKYPVLSSDWLSLTALHHMFKFSMQYLHKLTDPYREAHPEYFKIAKTKTGRISELYAPELVQIITNVKASEQPPIEGWISLNSLAGKLDIGWDSVKRTIEKYRSEYTSHLRVFKISVNGKLTEHISPTLANLIAEEYRLTEPPEGWIKSTEAARLLNMKPSNFGKFLKRQRKKYPDHYIRIRSSRDTVGQAPVYISPSLLKVLQEERQKLIPPPEGWITIPTLANKIGVSMPTARKIVEEHRNASQNHIGSYEYKKGHIAEYCSPELASAIFQDLSNLTEPEEGWMKVSAVANELRLGYGTIHKFIKEYEKSHPEYIKLFKADRIPGKKEGYRILKHISPELVTLLRDKYSQMYEAKPGWMFNSALAAEMHISSGTITRFANQFRESNPDYFQIARNPNNGKIHEYFSPELVEKIRKELSYE